MPQSLRVFFDRSTADYPCWRQMRMLRATQFHAFGSLARNSIRPISVRKTSTSSAFLLLVRGASPSYRAKSVSVAFP